MYKPKGGSNDQLALESKSTGKYTCDIPRWSGRPHTQEKWREERYAPPFSSQHWSSTKVSFHHSDVPTRLQRKLWIGCLQRRAFARVPRPVHVMACKQLVCSQACGLWTMICLQADWQGLQSLQTYDMFASRWLAKISYFSKPRKIIPFLF
jgi:hypothetical protein